LTIDRCVVGNQSGAQHATFILRLMAVNLPDISVFYPNFDSPD
jgi:hypothetical protein